MLVQSVQFIVPDMIKNIFLNVDFSQVMVSLCSDQLLSAQRQ